MTASKGLFFAIDQRTWAKLISLGMNEAVAYLVLAQGTGANHKATSWSVNSLKTHAGISWERGKAAIENLKRSGFLRLAESHTSGKPRYELPTFGELVDRQSPKIPPPTMTTLEGRLVANLRLGIQPKNKTERKRADYLFARHLLVQDGQGLYRIPETLIGDARENLIWLPNTIITGTKIGEESPVRRLRAAGDIWALQLFVELYSAQNLPDNGGISPHLLRQKYERGQVGQQGAYTLWSFKTDTLTLWFDGPLAAHQHRGGKKDHPVWGSISLLQSLGLLAFVPHLFENSSSQAEAIHSYGIGDGCEDAIERQIGDAADAAARAMCHPAKLEIAEENGFEYFCPVLCTKPDVQMIGVARLRYRPHTKRTAAWYAELHQLAGVYIANYLQLAEKARIATPALGANLA